MDLTIITTIKENSEVKAIQRCCNKILKKLSFKSGRDLQRVADLVTLLYIHEKNDEVMKVFEIVKDVTFDGNYNTWAQVRMIRYIVARIMREQGREYEYREIITGIVPALPRENYQNGQKVLDLYTQNSINAIEQYNSKSEANDWKLLKLQTMIHYCEIKDYPMDKNKLNKDIDDLKKELRDAIK